MKIIEVALPLVLKTTWPYLWGIQDSILYKGTSHLATLHSIINNKSDHLKQNRHSCTLDAILPHDEYIIAQITQFIGEQRCGVWKAQHNCVKRITPFFHAGGHFPL